MKGLRIMLRFEHRPYQVQSDGASQLVAMFIANINHTHVLCVQYYNLKCTIGICLKFPC